MEKVNPEGLNGDLEQSLEQSYLADCSLTVAWLCTAGQRPHGNRENDSENTSLFLVEHVWTSAVCSESGTMSSKSCDCGQREVSGEVMWVKRQKQGLGTPRM